MSRYNPPMPTPGIVPIPPTPPGLHVPEDFIAAAERWPVEWRDAFHERVGVLSCDDGYAWLSWYSVAWDLTVEAAAAEGVRLQ